MAWSKSPDGHGKATVPTRWTAIGWSTPGSEADVDVADGLGDPFDALGDAHRRQILRLLADRQRSVQQIAAELPISRPAVSRHLRVLKEAGLVRQQPAGTRRIYRLQASGAIAVQQYLEQIWGEAGARFRLCAQNTAGEADDD